MFDSYKALAAKTFGQIADRHGSLLLQVRPLLRQCGWGISFRNYISIVFLTSFITATITAGILIMLITAKILQMNLLVTIFTLIFVPIVIGVVTLFFMLFIPYQTMISRRRSIETNMPFAVAHMGAIAASGISPSAVFKLLAEFVEYEALNEEFKKIVRNIDIFGLDPTSAMREVAKRTPSEDLRQLLFGFVSTVESGGNLKFYLRNAGKQALFTWRMKREKYLQQLSAYAEFYTGLLIAAPLFLIALFSVMNMIQPQIGGFGILQLMNISIYLVVPLLNIGFLMFLQATQVEM